jgi:hypothetical protein
MTWLLPGFLHRTRPKYFPNLPAVDGCRDIVIAMSNNLPRQMQTVSRRNLEEISHGQHC